jgi:uncharacterized OB-fold protein
MTAVPHMDLPRVENRIRWDSQGQCLVGAECGNCGTLIWPGRTGCPACGAFEMKEAAVARGGDLLSWTRVFVPLAGIEAPFILAQVRLDDGVLLFGHLHGTPESGARRVTVHVDESQRPPFWFQLDEA